MRVPAVMTPLEHAALARIIRERRIARTAILRATLAIAPFAGADPELAALVEREAAAFRAMTTAVRQLRDRLRGARAERAA